MQPYKSHSKVFFIGLPRCGGQTLQRAMQLLFPNYAHWHSPGNAWSKMGSDFLSASEVFAPLDWLEKYYPRSLYIYNNRDPQSWFKSCQSVYGKSLHWNSPLWKYTLDQFQHYREDYEASRLSEWNDNLAGRLVEIDIIANPGWPELCGALQVDPPGFPFPRVDRFK